MEKSINNINLIKSLLIIIIILISSFLLSGCFFETDNENGKGSGNSNSNVSNYIGEYVVSGDLQFKVLNVQNTKQILGSYGSVLKETENNYVIITMQIKNLGNSENTIYDDNFNLKNNNNSYEVNYDGIYLDNGFWLSEKIGAGLTKTIKLLYETPTRTDSNIYILYVDDGLFSTQRKIILRKN